LLLRDSYIVLTLLELVNVLSFFPWRIRLPPVMMVVVVVTAAAAPIIIIIIIIINHCRIGTGGGYL